MAPGVPVDWEIMLVAAVVGVVLGISTLAALYLAPLARLYLAGRNPDASALARVLGAELDRLRRLGDVVAVLEEHGNPDAEEVRSEIEIRTLLLALGAARAVTREDRLSAPRRAREGSG